MLRQPARALLVVMLLACGCVVSAARAADGESVYRATCSTCHDSGAGGAPRTGRADEWEARFPLGRAALQAAAIDGIAGTAMAARGGFGQLSIGEVRAAVDYMLARTGFAEPVVTRPRVRVAPASVSATSAATDAVVTARVAAALRKQLARADAPVDADADDLIVRGVGIRVGTVAGVVRLMGVVQDSALAKRAESVARAVEGVRGIDNRLVSGGMLDFD